MNNKEIFKHKLNFSFGDISIAHMMEQQSTAIKGIYMMIRACNIQLKLSCLQDKDKHLTKCPTCQTPCHVWLFRAKLCESLIICATPNNMIDELCDDVLAECNYEKPEKRTGVKSLTERSDD